MADRPRASVVVTAYNGRRFLAETLESILAQTFTDFELLVIDDASSDDSPEIARAFARRDARVRLLVNERNLGISNTRNRGLELARGDYLAACDQDDLWLPEKLGRQVATLDAEPDLVLLATGAKLLVDGRLLDYYDAPTTWPVMHWALLTACPIVHASICMRLATLREHGIRYRQDYHYAEDYDLHHQLARVGHVRSLPERLTIYREHGGNTSRLEGETMREHGTRFLAEVHRELLGRAVPIEEIERVRRIVTRGKPARDEADLLALGASLRDLLAAFLGRTGLEAASAEAVRRHASQAWWRAVRRTALERGPRVLSVFAAVPELVAAPPSLAVRERARLEAALGPRIVGALAPRMRRLIGT
jgi:GT2 family glycosyltransferase